MEKRLPTSVLAGLLCSAINWAPVSAAPVDDAIKQAIVDEKVFPAETGMTVGDGSDGKEVSVRQSNQSSEKECKINAVLVAKAAMTADKSIVRVTVHFFNPDRRLFYRSISITSGDIKSFGSGAEGKEQLLSSLVLSPEQRISANGALESVGAASALSSVHSKVEKTTVHINGTMSALIDSDDYKFVALQLAERAVLANPDTTTCNVSLAVDNGTERSTQLATAMIGKIDASLADALSAIKITVGTGKDAAVAASNDKCLQLAVAAKQKLNQLEKDRKGVGPQKQALENATQAMSAGDSAKAEAILTPLNALLDRMVADSAARKQQEPAVAAAPPPKPAEHKSMYPTYMPPQQMWKRILGDPYAGGSHVETERLDSDPVAYLRYFDTNLRLKKHSTAQTFQFYEAFCDYCAVYFAQQGNWQNADIFLKAKKDIGLVPHH